jgi:tRNA(fMet)-specific endonuclease VapC
MGVILDSSIVIAAERRGDTVAGLLKQIAASFGDQEAALSSIGLTELIHGIHRAIAPDVRQRREHFIGDLLAEIPVYPFTRDTAILAGKLDAEQQARGNVIPFPDLLIGATALWLDYQLLTVNLRHFQKIPGLAVRQLA